MSALSIYADLVAAEERTLGALNRLTPDTEYLRDELEALLERFYILRVKMDGDEALQRDRAFLLSPDPPADGVGEWLGGSGNG